MTILLVIYIIDIQFQELINSSFLCYFNNNLENYFILGPKPLK